MFREYKTFAQILIISLSLMNSSVGEESAQIPANGPLRLSIDDVFKRIKNENLEVLISKESVQRALEQSYQRRAVLLPQFNIRSVQTRRQLARGFTSEEFDTPPYNSFGARVEASVSVFDTQQYADFQLAKLNYAIEQLQYAVVTQDYLEQAILLYFTHLRDLRSIEIAKENLGREEALLALARQQFDAGAAVKIDVTRAKVRIAIERRQLMEAEVDVLDSALLMKALLDIDLDREIDLDRSIISKVVAPPSIKKYGSQEVLTELRPELQSQRKAIEQAELTKKAVKWKRLPTVELFADWGYDSNHALDGDEGEAWLIGVRAYMPIWEGGRIASEQREAAAAMRQNEYQMRNLRNQVVLQFKLALVEMDSLYSQITIAGEEVRLGQDEVKLATERYREGLGDNLELIDAQQRLSDAERSELRALYLYGLSRLAFARSIGAVERVLD